MRSIRLSLVLYFLGLLVVALGAASFWAYHLAGTALAEKKQTTEELVDSQFRDRCRQEEARLDDMLLKQAQTVAQLAYFYSDSTRATNYRLMSELGVLTSAVSPNAWAPVASYLNQSHPFSQYSVHLWQQHVAKIRFNEVDLFQKVDVAEYFQVDSSWGSSYRSPSLGTSRLGEEERIRSLFKEKDEAISWSVETNTLNGQSIRRVVLKVPATRFLPWGTPIHGMSSNPWSGRPGDRRDGPRPQGSPGHSPQGGKLADANNFSGPRPLLLIQCACNVSQHEAILEGYRVRHDGELEALEAQTGHALANLRERLWWLGGGTFTCMLLGTLAIVRWGLWPLRRLGEAVRQVSTRDFKLPLDPTTMPQELQPIVQHLRATLDMLQRAFAREKQATADISHELRTPLATLLTTTELALRKQRSPEEYREMIAECRSSAQQMNRIVERLLTLARVDAGVDVVRPQAIDVGLLAEQCAAAVRPLAEARGLTLSVQVDVSVTASTDPDKLREVITNLLHNAIQYNRPQGTIEIDVHGVSGRIHVEVRDTGIGIAPDALHRIFERFYRADPSRGGDGLNAGLGLAIVKEYVELLGGTIAVESQIGRGTTFRVDLPPVLSRI